MEVKKGYKQTEIGIIPEEWEIKKIGEISNIDPESLCANTNPNYALKYISLEDVDSGKLLNISELIFKNAPSRARRIINKQDILISTVRPNLKSHLLIKHEVKDWICSTGFSVIRCKELINPYFIFYHLFFSTINIQINNLISGSNYPAISKKDIELLKIPLPPLHEQTAIANALSDINALIESLEKLITKKRNIKQGTMQQLLTGKKRLPGFGGDGISRKGYKLTEVGIIPEDWEVVRLGDVCSKIIDGTHRTPNYINDGIPFYSVENVTNNDFFNTKFISKQEHYQLIKRCKPEKGDILLTRIGTLGLTKLINWEVEASIYVSLALLKLNSIINNNYLYVFTKSKQFINNVEKRSLINAIPQKINMEEICKISIVVPINKEEQTAIAEVLSDMDSEIEALEKKLNKYKKVKQGMMQELLTGKKRLI